MTLSLSPPWSSLPLQHRIRRMWWAYAVIALLTVAASLWASGEIGRRHAEAALEERARMDARLNAALLRTVLEKYRALPFVLSQDAALASALTGNDAGTFERLSQKLEMLAAGTKAAVIYVIDKEGMAVSASNWREPTSFVGNDYRFREYFQGAVALGQAEHFALGTVSKKPGLYISERITGSSGLLGVVVVKVEFDDVEADWKASDAPSYVIDDRGIILITSVPSWRFMTIGRIADDRLTAIRESLQFGDAPLQPLPLDTVRSLGDRLDVVEIVMPGGAGKTRFLDVGMPVPATAWHLQHLVALGPSVDAGIREARMLALLMLLPLLSGAAFLLRRRQTVTLKIFREQQAREELERRVVERTLDLSQARDRLQAEITGHRSTEQKLQAVQQDLVQANRLAILGQVAAGVAHEINQPVATIRAYADNARTFLDRGQTAPAGENLESIAALTERIGSITEELKTFARKGRGNAEPTGLKDVIEGAVMLLRSRFAGRMDTLAIDLPPAELQVMGNRIRLEQVLINLLQNALEAVAPKAEEGHVEIRTSADAGIVTVMVADNGPGISPEIRKGLFTPFNTSKESGLGLGLVISKDIVGDYGGRMEVESDDSGTRFMVHLRKA
ncbi:two-component system C4-dicarboxylate transport sensor histidine kinase DctB [Rhizobium leguminosarum]|uniref:C4-dicarboxylate transport sensor protein n=2 Tax=Rhizobium/Agrobacterium group TaxID=227290 RepID=A0AAE2SY61_RHILE|nr:two-component system C4-dicarboxylate transport sensor histidine kinase DctB [Rhizobium leguminosarum]MBB4430377.1 two-component system C4-dicarboxylate transport sensor histidine kinase DctB [Rhizobium esperanzae]MBB4297680.1 two-component system C4-dicarboxylate transport sensor histidine kinase DctB [Rhizobium leguminosarum]MBB4308820.1 two-component system C4-dicarboxylate transport sensor histidine kinase DctB [Rhizobium leguminosarum]MBB4416655.1 two-component system C4-dicarboxylate t